MSDFADVGPPSGNAAKTCFWKKLTEEQRVKVEAAVEAGYSQPQIVTVLNRWGINVGRTSLGNHLRGVCTCAG
jgi:hypothetical protein